MKIRMKSMARKKEVGCPSNGDVHDDGSKRVSAWAAPMTLYVVFIPDVRAMDRSRRSISIPDTQANSILRSFKSTILSYF